MIRKAILSPERSTFILSSSQRGLKTAEATTSENSNSRRASMKVDSRDLTNLTELGKRGLEDRWRFL